MSDAAQSPPNENNAPAPAAEEQQLPGPGAFLKGVVGQPVVVRLNSGVDYRGMHSQLSLSPLTMAADEPVDETRSHPPLPQAFSVASTAT